MDTTTQHTLNTCNSCSIRYVCPCLKITEEVLLEAIATSEITCLDDIRQRTGAGDGCTACHSRLKRYLDLIVQPSSSEPICSLR